MTRLPKWLGLTIPYWLTEEMAVNIDLATNEVEIMCCMDDVSEGEVFDGIATVKALSLFGWGFFARIIGDIRPWPSSLASREPSHDSKRGDTP